MSGATLATKDAVDPLIHKAYLAELADAYAPPPIDRSDPLISPLFADLAGFPPILIQVGSAETLLADATRLAEAAGAADVDVTLRDLAAHDPCVAGLECQPRRRPPRAGERRAIHPARILRIDAWRTRAARSAPKALILWCFARNPVPLPANPGF